MKQEELSNWIRRVERKIAGAQRRTQSANPNPKVDPAPTASVDGKARPIPQSAASVREAV